MKLSANQIKTLRSASRIQEKMAKYGNDIQFADANTAKTIFANRLLGSERELFEVAFLDNQHRLIECETLFSGTIDGAAVYPREVVKRALELNSSAVVIAHNHPSGVVTPSEADKRITRRLVDALNLVDIRVLDHIIVGKTAFSFAENSLM